MNERRSPCRWGVSNENAFGITMLCTTCIKLGCPLPVSCQNDFSILNQTYEEDTYEAAYRFGIVGLPYGALCGGTLTGKYFEKSKPEYAAKDAAERPLDKCRHRIKSDFQPRYGEKIPMAATAEVVELAEQWGITPAELSIAWAIARPCNASVIIGRGRGVHHYARFGGYTGTTHSLWRLHQYDYLSLASTRLDTAHHNSDPRFDPARLLADIPRAGINELPPCRGHCKTRANFCFSSFSSVRSTRSLFRNVEACAGGGVCSTSLSAGTTTVRQVEECVNAALLDLPDELVREVDKIHERYRNPCVFYADKEAWMDGQGRTASTPEA